MSAPVSEARVLVAQSPLVIPDDWQLFDAAGALARLASDAGLETSAESCHASAGLRFGWNRHGLGERVGEHRRLRARRCIEPGSVLVLREAAPDLPNLLLRGLGDGREQGMGALAPHPGIATKLHRPVAELRSRGSRDEAGRLGLELCREAGEHGPSPSQIGAVAGRLRESREETLSYLERQLKGSERRWRRWKSVGPSLQDLIKKNQLDVVHSALRVWQSLAIVNRKERP